MHDINIKHALEFLILRSSALDPFNFYADMDPHWRKMDLDPNPDPDPSHFF